MQRMGLLHLAVEVKHSERASTCGMMASKRLTLTRIDK
jgi:hypothetical protein